MPITKTRSFNPRPSRKRGATVSAGSTPARINVSILAPLARGALRRGRRRRRHRGGVSILAPLARGALRGPRDTTHTHPSFQSSPLSQEGRYTKTRIRAARFSGFNPRPSRKRGATRLDAEDEIVGQSFNPRPSRKRGATRRGGHVGWRRRVSILAPLARGALLKK